MNGNRLPNERETPGDKISLVTKPFPVSNKRITDDTPAKVGVDKIVFVAFHAMRFDGLHNLRDDLVMIFRHFPPFDHFLPVVRLVILTVIRSFQIILPN